MVKVIRIFVVMTLLLAAFASPAMAAHERPVKGTVTGEHGPPDFTKPGCPDEALWRYSSEGVGRVSHLGRVEYTLTQCTAPGPEGIASEGTVKLVAANGDELWLKHTMLSQMFGDESGPPLGFTFVGTWEAVGGTGRFAHAVGRGMLDGAGDIPGGGAYFDGIPDGLLQLNLRGSIAYDANDRSRR